MNANRLNPNTPDSRIFRIELFCKFWLILILTIAFFACKEEKAATQQKDDVFICGTGEDSSEESLKHITLNIEGNFGFSDSEGKRIIVKCGDKNTKDFDLAVCSGGTVAEIKFSGVQKGDEEKSNHRDNANNFDNLAGNIFEVVNVTKGKLEWGNDCFLTKKSFESSLIPLIKIEEYQKVDATTIKNIEKQKGRKIAKSELLAKTASGAKICLFQFARNGKDMLGSFVYIDGDKTIYKDYPAEYDDISTWRVDDNGEFGGISPLFLARTTQGLIMGVAWYGESTNTWISVEKDGKFIDSQFRESFYTAPE